MTEAQHPMKTLLRLLAATASLGLLASCASHPVGVTKSEWQALSPQLQAKLYEREFQAYLLARRDGNAFSGSLGPIDSPP